MAEKTVCPFCKEEINKIAIICPHCLTEIPPSPTHGGTCPACGENIDPQANRCPHCKSWVGGRRMIDIEEATAGRDAEVSTIKFPEIGGESRKPPLSRERSLQCRTRIDVSTYNPETGMCSIMEKCYDSAGRLVFERRVGWIEFDPMAR